MKFIIVYYEPREIPLTLSIENVEREGFENGKVKAVDGGI